MMEEPNEIQRDEVEEDGVGGGGHYDYYFTELSSDDDLGEFDGDAHSFRKATELLGSVWSLCIYPPFKVEQERDDDDDDDDDGGTANAINGATDGNDARSVRRFVAELGRDASMRRISIGDMIISDVMAQEELERLCRDVLPVHPTLEELTVGMPHPYVEILASSLRAESRLRAFWFYGAVDRDTVQSIADMIVRRDGPPLLTRLHMNSEKPRLDAANCTLLCQAVSRSQNLRKLFLELGEVGTADGNALDGAVASTSPLRTLGVYLEAVSDECVASVARLLRTNTTLVRLHLHVRSDESIIRQRSPFLGPIVEVLKNYNVTLRRVDLRPRITYPRPEPAVADMDRYVRRNRRIRRALEQLEPRRYHMSPPSLWPHAFEMVKTLPNLLYRFLRRDNLAALCDVLLPPESSTKGKKKRARPVDD